MKNYIPRLDTKNLTCGMQFEILVIKISNGFQFFRSNEEESYGNQW